MRRSTARETLDALIRERNAPGADHAVLDHRIHALFGERRAVLVTDMSGFTRRTDEFGIIHFLSLIGAMQDLAAPVILHHDGMLLKTEADNLLVLFRDPLPAFRCAEALHAVAGIRNRNRHPDECIHFCAGIGYGDILLLGDEDAFGAEVNRAFKLGEDIARAGETLLTPDAHAALAPHLPGRNFSEIATDNAGLMRRHYRSDP